MNTLVVFAALAAVVLSGPVPEDELVSNENAGAYMEYFLVEQGDGLYEVEDLVNARVDTRAADSDVTYHFFTVHNPTHGTTLKSNEIEALQNTEFDPSKVSVFVVHGWKDHNESTYNTGMRETLLSQYDVNVFVVDWEPIAAKNYISAKNSVVKIGTYIASFIQSLASTYGLELSKVSFVGHSLGAHISGNAGAALGGQVGYIIGLDPAGPLFSESKVDERLDPTDAKFVAVIHTNGGTLGYDKSIGHADYYPNGGSSQPGCILDIAGACAHARSYAYFAESVTSGDNAFVATQCSSYTSYRLGRCSSNPTSQMASFRANSRASGDYYLKTNSKAFYALG